MIGREIETSEVKFECSSVVVMVVVEGKERMFDIPDRGEEGGTNREGTKWPLLSVQLALSLPLSPRPTSTTISE